MTAIAASLDRFAFLRRALLVDAATCIAMGALLLLLSAALSSLLGLPGLLLERAGLSLLPIAAFMTWVATRGEPSQLATWMVIAGNGLWVAGSALLLISGWVSPTALGYAFVVAQAAAVVLLAELEYIGLRKAST